MWLTYSEQFVVLFVVLIKHESNCFGESVVRISVSDETKSNTSLLSGLPLSEHAYNSNDGCE